MELELFRGPSADGATIGKLSINGVFECYILEDVVREIPGRPVYEWKIKGATAIPTGRYKVIIDYSTRFKTLLPLLVDVPGFRGIRIHPGNSSLDTEGCLLPGRQRSTATVQQSRQAFSALFDKLREALSRDEPCYISIHNAPVLGPSFDTAA